MKFCGRKKQDQEINVRVKTSSREKFHHFLPMKVCQNLAKVCSVHNLEVIKTIKNITLNMAAMVPLYSFHKGINFWGCFCVI